MDWLDMVVLGLKRGALKAELLARRCRLSSDDGFFVSPNNLPF